MENCFGYKSEHCARISKISPLERCVFEERSTILDLLMCLQF